MKTSKVQMPWLDDRGAAIPTEQLKHISKAWNSETWEAYLQFMERPRREALIPERQFDEIAEAQTESIFYHFDNTTSDVDKMLCENLLSELSQREATILRLIYFEGLTERKIAAQQNISNSEVNKIKKRALQKLQDRVGGIGSTRRIMKGQFVEKEKNKARPLKKAS